MPFSIFLRWPSDTPSDCRSDSVRSGRTSRSMSFSEKASTYLPSPRPSSHSRMLPATIRLPIGGDVSRSPTAAPSGWSAPADKAEGKGQKAEATARRSALGGGAVAPGDVARTSLPSQFRTWNPARISSVRAIPDLVLDQQEEALALSSLKFAPHDPAGWSAGRRPPNGPIHDRDSRTLRARRVTVRTHSRPPARSADPPRSYSRDERRQLPAQTEPPAQARRLNQPPEPPCGRNR